MKDVLEAIRSLRGKTLILTHHNADIDAMSSALALSLGLKQKGILADVGVAESVGRSARKIAEGHEILTDPDCSGYDNVIVVETSVPEQLATIKNLRADMIIDHHPPGPLAKGAKSWIDENERSTAQMIYQLLKQLDCTVNKEMAIIMATGLVADTSHLRHARKKEFEILIELLGTGIEYQDVLKKIEMVPDGSQRTACLKAASRLELHKVGTLLVAFSSVKSHEAAAARALIKIGADIAVVFAKKEKELRISSRGRRQILEYGLDLSEIFKEVGKIIGGSGGGHDLAGSANGKDTKAVGKAKEFVLRAIREKRNRPKSI